MTVRADFVVSNGTAPADAGSAPLANQVATHRRLLLGELEQSESTDVRELIGPHIRAAVDRLPPSTRRLAERHFGFHDGDAAPVAGVGKGLRASLTLLCAQAVEGRIEQAMGAAVAVELVHNASLLHDDIIDRDRMRRGRPALWASDGVPAAILAGDALFFGAVQILSEAPDGALLVPVLLDSVQTLISGEYLDVFGSAGDEAGEAGAMLVAAAKTGSLFECACALGAIAGGAGLDRVDHLRRFGHHLGISFQCVDDLLGIWGQPSLTGKPRWSDLRERKITVPVAAAMATHTPHSEGLRALYAGDDLLGERECARAAQLIEETGARARTLGHARSHITKALEHLRLAEPAPAPADTLTALVHSTVCLGRVIGEEQETQ